MSNRLVNSLIGFVNSYAFFAPRLRIIKIRKKQRNEGDIYMHIPEEKQVTHRSINEKEQLINRLKRIEGQVRGIQGMIENDRYCVDILTQISAINAALNKVGIHLLERHTQHCVTDAIKDGDGEEAIQELMEVFKRFSKS